MGILRQQMPSSDLMRIHSALHDWQQVLCETQTAWGRQGFVSHDTGECKHGKMHIFVSEAHRDLEAQLGYP